MQKIICAALFLGLLVAPVQAAVPPAKTLTAQDQADLKSAQDYLNNLKTLQARILQLNPDGSIMGGVLKIQRPGKLRLDYDAPVKSFLVADGTFVHFWDDSLQQTSSVPQDGSPAALILDAQIDINKNMTITDVTRSTSTLEVTVYKTDDPANGTLTLVFEQNPLRLRQWLVRDAQNTLTQVTLQNMDSTAQFDSGTFVYRPLNFGKNR